MRNASRARRNAASRAPCPVDPWADHPEIRLTVVDNQHTVHNCDEGLARTPPNGVDTLLTITDRTGIL